MENAPTVTQKGFWQRPEGKTGAVVAAGGAAIVGYGAWVALPIIITLMANTVAVVGMGIAGVLAFYTVFINKRTRTTLWYAYKSAMRRITGMFINLDPLNTLKTYVKDLKKKLQSMDEQIANLKGQMINLNRVMRDNEKEAQTNNATARKARKENMMDVANLKSRRSRRLIESNKNLAVLYQKLEGMYMILGKMYKSSKFMVEDLTDEVKIKERERNAIRATESAFKSAKAILAGQDDKRQIFDETIEGMVAEVDMAMGRIERFMETSTEFIKTIDLEHGSSSDELFLQFEKSVEDEHVEDPFYINLKK